MMKLDQKREVASESLHFFFMKMTYSNDLRPFRYDFDLMSYGGNLNRAPVRRREEKYFQTQFFALNGGTQHSSVSRNVTLLTQV